MKVLFFVLMAAVTLSLAVARTYAFDCPATAGGTATSDSNKDVLAVGATDEALGIKAMDAKKDKKDK